MAQITTKAPRNYGKPAVFDPANPFGTARDSSAAAIITKTTIRKWKSDRKWLFHRQKNGIYDPITYALIIEAILSLVPGEYWYAGGLAQHLNETEPAIVWDAITVGRVLSDIADSGAEILAPHERAIERSKNYQGRFYAMTNNAAGRRRLVNLRNQMRDLAQQVIEAERRGEPARRSESPITLLGDETMVA